MFKKLILGLAVLAGQMLHAENGITADYVRFNSTTLPSICRVGDLRVSSSTSTPQFCRTTNTWKNLFVVTTLGDIIYGSAANTQSRLAGNTTSIKQYLSQTGTGTVSAAPSWSAIQDADLPTIAISGGGTGQTTRAPAINALLPSQSGNTGLYLTTNGTDASWATTGILSPTAVKTANYTALNSDGIVLGNASGGAFTFTCPTGPVTGKEVTFKKIITDTSFNQILLSCTGLTAQYLSTLGETVTLFYDGSNWFVKSRYFSQGTYTYTMTVTATGGVNPTFGTVVTNLATWQRIGDKIYVTWTFQQSTAGLTQGSGAYQFKIPTGLTANTSLVTLATTPGTATVLNTGATIVGTNYISSTSANSANRALNGGNVSMDTNTTVQLTLMNDNVPQQSFPYSSSSGNGFTTTPLYLTFFATIPVNGSTGAWNP